MKIILSRKGFDSANGGIVSPIFEDGTMVSFPIPSDDEDTYDSLYYNGIQYSQILRDLRYKGGDHCHLDPDLDLGRRRERIDGWFPAFGQRNAAAAYLKNIGVAQGDIFLFFGNFHFVEYQNGTYRYLRDRNDFYRGKDLQVIWGYLQVGEIISVPEEQRKVWWHPHSSNGRADNSTNVIFKAAERLSLDKSKPGAGVLRFDKKRVLTLKGATKATWARNEVYDETHIYGKRSNCATFDDFRNFEKEALLEIVLRSVRGMGDAGVNYMFMMAGDPNRCKPDVHIHRCIKNALGTDVPNNECQILFRETVKKLKDSGYPDLTVRNLDSVIWNKYQKNRSIF